MKAFRPEADPPVAAALRRWVAEHERRWVLAVSGGADSLYLMLQCAREAARRGIRPLVVHVNHGLRGADSDQDEAFVRAQARLMRLPLRVVLARPHALAGNVPDLARRLRRQALEEAAGPQGLIFLGHHAGDQRESALAALLKGKAPAVIGGMPARRGTWIRPLLELDPMWMRQRLRRCGQAWREDASNALPWCERNHLRLQVLAAPQRTEEMARVLDRVGEEARHLARNAEILSGKLLDQLDLQPTPCGLSLERPRHLSYHEGSLEEALRLLCRRLGLWSRDPSRSCLERAARQVLEGRSGSRVPLGRHWLELGRQRAWLVLKEVPAMDLTLRRGERASGAWGHCGFCPSPPRTDWIWAGTGARKALRLRRWQAGDRLPQPGRRGILVADLMGELGFTPTQKALQVVLTDESGSVLACPGLHAGFETKDESEPQLPIWMTSCPSPSTKWTSMY